MAKYIRTYTATLRGTYSEADRNFRLGLDTSDVIEGDDDNLCKVIAATPMLAMWANGGAEGGAGASLAKQLVQAILTKGE